MIVSKRLEGVMNLEIEDLSSDRLECSLSTLFFNEISFLKCISRKLCLCPAKAYTVGFRKYVGALRDDGRS